MRLRVEHSGLSWEEESDSCEETRSSAFPPALLAISLSHPSLLLFKVRKKPGEAIDPSLCLWQAAGQMKFPSDPLRINIIIIPTSMPPPANANSTVWFDGEAQAGNYIRLALNKRRGHRETESISCTGTGWRLHVKSNSSTTWRRGNGELPWAWMFWRLLHRKEGLI